MSRALSTGGGNGSQRMDPNGEEFVVVSALDRQAGWPDDNMAQAGHLIPAATGVHITQDPITLAEASLPLGRKSTGNGVQSGSMVRRLTPVECERLMSWPDGWTAVDGEQTPDGRRYAACGDGVVSNVSEWIGRRILAVDREQHPVEPSPDASSIRVCRWRPYA